MGVNFQLRNCCFGFILQEMQHKVHIFRLEGSEFWLCSGQIFHAPFGNVIYLKKKQKKKKTHACMLLPYMRFDFGTRAHVHYVCLSGRLSRSADPPHPPYPSFIWIKIYFMLIAAWGNSVDTVNCQWWHPITASMNDCTSRTALKSYSIILLTVYY